MALDRMSQYRARQILPGNRVKLHSCLHMGSLIFQVAVWCRAARRALPRRRRKNAVCFAYPFKVGQEACEVEGHMALVGLGLKRVLVWHGEIAQTIHHEVEHVGGNTELLTFNPGIRQKTTAAMGTVAGAGRGRKNNLYTGELRGRKTTWSIF